MDKAILQKRINDIKGTDKVNDLIGYMLEQGFALEKYSNVSKANKNAIKHLTKFFTEGVKKEKEEEPSGEVVNVKEDIVVESKINEEEKVEEDTKADNEDVTPPTSKRETKAQIVKKYKTLHNLASLTEGKNTVLENVREVTDTGEDLIYSCDLNGVELATMFLGGTLVYDPTMQRGLKEDNKGNMIANFKDYHVKEIYDSIKNNTFTPTQIHLAILTDDEETKIEYFEDEEVLTVDGKIRLVDGQHRTRAFAKALNEIKVGKIDGLDLEKYVFNVQIHVTKAEYARIIYSNIDKNLKLDKSQVRQLSADHYARIVNALNQHSDSVLRNKIATSKPVGNKLVLFSNIADAIEKSVTISSSHQREEVIKYLKEFFDYLAYKMPQAFGENEKERAEFRKDNLLNENNAFQMWVKLAFHDQSNFDKNIDLISKNATYFNKNHEGEVVIDGETRSGNIWLLLNTVKHKQKGDGFAMNNTNTGINAITNQVLNMIGGDNEKQ